MIPILLALGTNTPLYRPVHAVVPGLNYPRVPERLMPVACLAIAALAAFAVGFLADTVFNGHGRGLTPVMAGTAGVVVAAIAVAVAAADLHVEALKASAADGGNKAYAALKGGPRDARLLELPVFLPDTHYGSVYLYYDMGPKRERPQGYSTTAPVAAESLGFECGQLYQEPRFLCRPVWNACCMGRRETVRSRVRQSHITERHVHPRAPRRGVRACADLVAGRARLRVGRGSRAQSRAARAGKADKARGVPGVCPVPLRGCAPRPGGTRRRRAGDRCGS